MSTDICVGCGLCGGQSFPTSGTSVSSSKTAVPPPSSTTTVVNSQLSRPMNTQSPTDTKAVGTPLTQTMQLLGGGSPIDTKANQPLIASHVVNTRAGRGAFIVFEGLDRSGKSTQCLALHQKIQSVYGPDASLHMRFPARETAVGKMIDAYLKNQSNLSDQAIHLLFAANRWEAVDRIRAALAKGVHVICDRYSYSGVAFSMAKGLNYEWCAAPEKGLIEPDAVVFMNLSPNEAQKRYAFIVSLFLPPTCVYRDVSDSRGGFGAERYETNSIQNAVRTVFEKYFIHASPKWHIVDGGQAVESLQQQIWTLAQQTFVSASTRSIDTIS